MIHPFYIFPITALLSYLAFELYRKQKISKTTLKSTNETKFKPPIITPIGEDFKWEDQKPYPYRPFKKGPYRMNLAIRKLDPNDIISIEDTYLDRINLRLKLFDETKLYGCHESALESLKEAYKFILNFLLKRYPQYFELIDNNTMFHNKIIDKTFPYDPKSMKSEEIFKAIVYNIEEDMLIMVKNSEDEKYDEYILRAAVSLHPSGFNPIEKLNQPLTKVHGPVPGYLQKLQLSMNRFFNRLQKYEFIVRNNWSLQTHTNLCAPTGQHATSEEAKMIHLLYPEDLDFNKCFFRVEKQCFTRLPETGSNLMFIRTYVTSLMELRNDLTDEQKDILCDAIDGISGDFAVYKRRIEWGEAAKSFIRGESNGSQPIPTKYKFIH